MADVEAAGCVYRMEHSSRHRCLQQGLKRVRVGSGLGSSRRSVRERPQRMAQFAVVEISAHQHVRRRRGKGAPLARPGSTASSWARSRRRSHIAAPAAVAPQHDHPHDRRAIWKLWALDLPFANAVPLEHDRASRGPAGRVAAGALTWAGLLDCRRPGDPGLALERVAYKPLVAPFSYAKHVVAEHDVEDVSPSSTPPFHLGLPPARRSASFRTAGHLIGCEDQARDGRRADPRTGQLHHAACAGKALRLSCNRPGNTASRRSANSYSTSSTSPLRACVIDSERGLY